MRSLKTRNAMPQDIIAKDVIYIHLYRMQCQTTRQNRMPGKRLPHIRSISNIAFAGTHRKMRPNAPSGRNCCEGLPCSSNS